MKIGKKSAYGLEGFVKSVQKLMLWEFVTIIS